MDVDKRCGEGEVMGGDGMEEMGIEGGGYWVAKSSEK